jgi:S1-C subfamily serine protease
MQAFDASAPARKTSNALRDFDPGTLVKKARDAVVLIQVYDKDGKRIGEGSGFYVSPLLVITNCHVLAGGSSATVRGQKGNTEWVSTVKGALAFDQQNDLVLLAVDKQGADFLTLGNSQEVEVGDHVAVIGSPLGLEGSLSEGIISAKREQVDSKRRFLQITAPISPGSSGSPVLDSSGKVVGIASAELRGGQSLNFAVPAELAAQLLYVRKPTGALIPLPQIAMQTLRTRRTANEEATESPLPRVSATVETTAVEVPRIILSQPVIVQAQSGSTTLPVGTEVELVSDDGSNAHIRYAGRDLLVPSSAITRSK